MKIYNTQAEVDADTKGGRLFIDDDVTFECDVVVRGNINVWNIISAGNITARDIVAGNITAENINAGDIVAVGNISAKDISYYVFCIAYQNITCQSIEGRRERYAPPICIDGKLTITPPPDTDVDAAIKLLTDKGVLVDGKVLKGGQL